MQHKDKINFHGEFSLTYYDEFDNIIDTYEDKNLIVNTARKNMAELIGGFVDGETNNINEIRLGTRGHIGNDITDNIQVGETDAVLGTFDATRTQLFSEELGDNNYHVIFDVTGAADVTDSSAEGTMYSGETAGTVDTTFNSVNRVFGGDYGNIVTYSITIPTLCGNLDSGVIAYTEAALYAGGELFAMKTFPARVKEDTVKLVITWSVVF